VGLSVTTEVNRKHLKTSGEQLFRLWRPAFFVEASSMCQYDSTFSGSIEISEHYSAVIGGK
jgi:hypothetical protein